MLSSLPSLLYTVAFALCAFSTGVLSRRSTADQPARFLLAFLVLESTGFFLELLVVHPASPGKSFWLGLLLASSLLTAPVLWLAIREAVTGVSPRLAHLPRGHFLVAAAGAVLVLPLIGAASRGTGWESGYGAHPPWHFHLIHPTMLACVALFAVQAPWYLWQAGRMLRAAAPQARPGAPQRWLPLLLVVVGTTWALGLLRTVQTAAHASRLWFVGAAAVDVAVTVGALYLILRAELSVASTPTPEPAAPDPPDAGSDAKYVKSPLEAARVARLRRRLTEVLAQQTLHHDSLLDLRTLSRHLAESPHAVSQVINQELGLSFHDLINRARIEDAKKRLREQPARSILEIAMEVGFNSKSTFNTAFRRHAGCTPSQYRKQAEGPGECASGPLRGGGTD